MKYKKIDALVSLHPTPTWILRGEDAEWGQILDSNGIATGEYAFTNFEWTSEIKPVVSEEQVLAELSRMEQEWNDTEYQRLRKPEYPPLADLADALYWQSEGDNTKMTAYLAAVDAVKLKYPKGV